MLFVYDDDDVGGGVVIAVVVVVVIRRTKTSRHCFRGVGKFPVCVCEGGGGGGGWGDWGETTPQALICQYPHT